MSKLQVEHMFTDQFFEVSRAMSSRSLNALDRKRMLEHIIGDVVSQLLSTTGSNPVGMTITVGTSPSAMGGTPDIVVTATAPRSDENSEFNTYRELA
jgi:hypothetical protein